MKMLIASAMALAMLAMASFVVSAQDLTGIAESLGSDKSKRESCKSAKYMARQELNLMRVAWMNVGKKVVKERVGSCDCEQEPDIMYGDEVLKKGNWKCLVEWSVDVEDWE